MTSPGNAVAYQEVEVRPRVGGVIEEVLYTPDEVLEVGDPLFRIDDSSYVAAEAAARADVATAEANLILAQASSDRAEKLVGRGYTEAEVESARATLAEAKATVDSTKAALEYAQTELSWTTIKSPIAGRADVSTVSVGDLVTAGQSDALTTIVQSDPIYVDMVEASARILSVRKAITEGTITQNDTLQASLTLENDDVYHGTGQLFTAGNSASTTTGTVTIRFRFDNPDHVIIPGMFVRGQVTIGTMQAFLVPQRAATRSNSGKLTAYVVGDDGKAQQITLEDDGSYDNSWIVRTGLNEGDQLIVDGLSSVKPGQDVKPVAATIDDDGIARDADTAAAED
ncbi:efflux RND transporter periplasmic adaptor subunit [Paracoccus sp. 1_MG-2023]|uniref:efflux RND transporter periplasmic adaptor subunit n=1 Tax=unclassified Paracoccus (in: a-proteobacteria) TaxID=2688777 RepID=UPI001C08A2C6|nr:efflux RND transporter periplasmic adaptor subunit [Paracoccus sp. 1_MG-2023]MBU2959194.1 efflux RND transporter periplasmic adaptor subunit [Paracoccus sp. C2R09]MDO6670069.1 efflux RND transporter periplasmic adaptor subunit [Paracoccus sp. 1_MG-2023]